MRVDATPQVNAVISPDGKHVVYSVGSTNDLGTGQLVETSGGVPRQLCEGCSLHGFLSDNRRVLAVWDDRHTIGIIDTVTGAKVELVRDLKGALIARTCLQTIGGLRLGTWRVTPANLFWFRLSLTTSPRVQLGNRYRNRPRPADLQDGLWTRESYICFWTRMAFDACGDSASTRLRAA